MFLSLRLFIKFSALFSLRLKIAVFLFSRLRHIPVNASIFPTLYLFRSPRGHTFLKESIKELLTLIRFVFASLTRWFLLNPASHEIPSPQPSDSFPVNIPIGLYVPAECSIQPEFPDIERQTNQRLSVLFSFFRV